MRQYFNCSNWECDHQTGDFRNKRLKYIYLEMEEEGYSIDKNEEKTVVRCKKCGSEMVYLAFYK